MPTPTSKPQVNITLPPEPIKPDPTAAVEENVKTHAAPDPSTDGPAQMSLYQLLGHIVATVSENHALMPQAKREMEVWWNAQSPDDRKEIARKARIEMEYCRGIIESAYQHFYSLTYSEL